MLCIVLLIISVAIVILLCSPTYLGRAADANTHVSCYLESAAFDRFDAKTKQAEKVEDWRVLCKVTRGYEVMYDRKLALPFPAKCAEATAAMCEFLNGGWKRATKVEEKNGG